MREEARCRHMGYYFQLTARVLLYAPSHRQDSTYHSLWYTSRGALAGTRNSSMGPPWKIDPTTHRTMSERSYHGATSRSLSYLKRHYDVLLFCCCLVFFLLVVRIILYTMTFDIPDVSAFVHLCVCICGVSLFMNAQIHNNYRLLLLLLLLLLLIAHIPDP